MQAMSLGLEWRRTLLPLVLSITACSSSPNFAGLETGPRSEHYRERLLVQKLSNGLRVVMLPDDRSNLIRVGVHYPVGGADDPEGADGLAHYVEHVMFDAAYRGPNGDALREVGLYKNAWTLKDRTYFTFDALDTDLDPAVEIAARRFEASCTDLDPATLARERDVVIEEEKLRVANPIVDILRGVDLAVWGPAHPYAHDVGGHGFADLPRPALCKFIAEHYGPNGAVVVIAGNIQNRDVERIRQRFERVPTRPFAMSAVPARPTQTSRVVMKHLEHPTVMLVYPAPGEGAAADAALDAIDGRQWLVRGVPIVTRVVGEQRQRSIIAIAAISDAASLDEAAREMRSGLARATVSKNELALYQQRKRSAIAAELDDTFASAEAVAVSVARGEHPTRFRTLSQLDALAPADLTQWFTAEVPRVALLLPQVGSEGKHSATETLTVLHELDIPHGVPPATDLARPTTLRPRSNIVEHRLANGLRVLLAPDPAAIGLDARLVIAGTADETAMELDTQAAHRLSPDVGSLMADDRARWTWYTSVGAPVVGDAHDGVTTFRLDGLALYADWHVWNLAWTVLHGTYGDGEKSSGATRSEAPAPVEIVSRNLAGAGVRAGDDGSVPSTDALQRFASARYRPERSTLIVTGRFDAAAIEKEIETLFGEWKSGGQPVAAAAKPPRVGAATGIEVNDSPTLDVAIAFPADRKSSVAESAAREVLESLVEMRMRVVRERLGASYGIHVQDVNGGLWIVGAVEPQYAPQAAQAIADELAHIRNADASVLEDFARARRSVFARALAMPAGAAKRAAGIEKAIRDGGDVAQADQPAEAIRTLEFSRVQELVARELRPERMIAAVRGEKTAAEAALGALGIAKGKAAWLAPVHGKWPAAPVEAPKRTATLRDTAVARD